MGNSVQTRKIEVKPKQLSDEENRERQCSVVSDADIGLVLTDTPISTERKKAEIATTHSIAVKTS